MTKHNKIEKATKPTNDPNQEFTKEIIPEGSKRERDKGKQKKDNPIKQ